ncbi:MAG: response regulator transcription factor, partial [Acholeplasmataceae bacterium]|nr:response regulator transcription factor [Acholeplasmataceae bacterium]
MFSVLIVEDDNNARKLMNAILKREGFTTHLANDGAEALEIIESKHIDIILLDVMMPNIDGFEFAKILRDANYNTPIIIITAKETIADKKRGFLIGVDDYMVKPVDEEELILRINALMRRAQINHEKIIKLKDITLNFNNLTVARNGEEILLPKKEFYLLFKLISFPNRIFTKQQLFEEIWGLESESMDHTITVHI